MWKMHVLPTRIIDELIPVGVNYCSLTIENHLLHIYRELHLLPFPTNRLFEQIENQCKIVITMVKL